MPSSKYGGLASTLKEVKLVYWFTDKGYNKPVQQNPYSEGDEGALTLPPARTFSISAYGSMEDIVNEKTLGEDPMHKTDSDSLRLGDGAITLNDMPLGTNEELWRQIIMEKRSMSVI